MNIPLTTRDKAVTSFIMKRREHEKTLNNGGTLQNIKEEGDC